MERKRRDALRELHDFTKRMRLDAGLTVRTLAGGDVVELEELLGGGDSADERDRGDSSSESSDGYDEPEFTVDPNAALAPDQGDESYIDPETGDFVEPPPKPSGRPPEADEPGEAASRSVSPAEEEQHQQQQQHNDEEKIKAMNVRRNIREVMDEKQLDASTLAAQRLESERLARVQEQQRIIREVRRQIAMSRQDKAQARVLSLLQGRGGKVADDGSEITLKFPSDTTVRPAVLPNFQDFTQMQCNLTPSVSIAPVGAVMRRDVAKIGPVEKRDIVEIVDSSSESESSEEAPSSDSDDCILLSDSELPPSPEPEDDPQNSGLHVNDAYNIPDEQGRVVINIGHPENEEDIFLAPQISRIIKPHQIGGVRFLFDNIIESTDRFENSTGFGCILAHSMGLGKTLQIVCFCDIFLRHTNSKTVLCIMPINTLQNWVAEFNMWLPLDASTSPLSSSGEVRSRNFPIYVLNDSHKTLYARAKVIKEWYDKGGVLMIGYELYRLLSLKKNKKPKNRRKKNEPFMTPTKDVSKDGMDGEIKRPETNLSFNPYYPEMSMDKSKDGDIKDFLLDKKDDDDDTDEEKKLLDEMHAALVKPGPDLVICDEGHRIKNTHSNISYALKQMRTKRRIVLTGYPLQNNLLEYWCMVDFVRPNYLGTKTEFSNMFERPIQNGQCIDSTPQDIRLMRYRAHVLHSLLVGFVQRRSHAVLQSTLPQKEEYVLLVKLTEFQRKLYDIFMNEIVRKKTVPNPLKAFAVCCKIWNHPDVLYTIMKERDERAAMLEYDLEIEESTGINPGNNQPPVFSKKGKERKPRAPSKRKDKSLVAKNDKAKPAASVLPNTNSTNVSNSFNNNNPIKSELPSAPSANYNNQLQYPPANNDNKNSFAPSNTNVTNFPPYQDYQQYPQNSYYNTNGSYDPSYNSTYYQNQPSYNNYNNYNMQNPTSSGSSAPQNPPRYPENSQYNNNQPYWGSDGNYYNNQGSNYTNQNNSNYSNQNSYNNVYNTYPQQPNQSFGGFNQNQTFVEDQTGTIGQQNNFQNNSHEPSSGSYSEPNTSSLDPPSAFDSNQINRPPTDAYPRPVYPSLQNATAQDIKPDPSTICWPSEGDDKKQIPLLSAIPPDIKSEGKTDSDSEIKIADLDTMKVIIDEKPKIKLDSPYKLESGVKDDLLKSDAVTREDFTNKLLPEGVIDFQNKNVNDGSQLQNQNTNHDSKEIKNGQKDETVNAGEADLDKKEKEEIDKKAERYEEVTYDWATELMKNYVPGVIENSAKMEIFFCILEESIHLGDRILLFSQSLLTLNLIEDFLQRRCIPGTEQLWAKNRSYYRLDGSTSALEREKLINEFNINPTIHLFLVSTRAGSLGINLVGANRVVVFDASWNPCHDTQAVCRVYRYGQQKPCFVYRLVMDNCLEKKIYDRQINKQGMSDRVVDECNPDAVLSLKEVTNLCFDSDEKDSTQDLSEECKDKYSDIIVKKIITEHGKTLNKEPFQHESLLVDRKEKKLSSAEKRLAQRGYELEKKAAANPKPGMMYRTIRAADGTIIQRPVASVRPMQHGTVPGNTRWIPADVWQRQGMTAQEMTLPLDVVIPTNSADKSNIVLKAGQKVMVLKSTKGIYMQLESGKIIAIKTSFKVGQNKPVVETKDINQPKKVMPIVQPPIASLPGSLKNNSAITVISKSARGGMQKVITRPPIIHKRIESPIRTVIPGPRIIDPKIRNLNANLQIRPYGIPRGRSPIIRSTRPIPIHNSVNIKIQGGPNQSHMISRLDCRDPNGDEEESNSDLEFEPKIDIIEYPETSQGAVDRNSGINIDDDDDIVRGSKENVNANVHYEHDVPDNQHESSVSEELASEDSSQEKSFLEMSERGNSTMNVKHMNKPTILFNQNIGSVYKGLDIKNRNFINNSPMGVEILNNVTIKRAVPTETTLLDSSISPMKTKNFGVAHLSEEPCSSEISLAGYKFPPQNFEPSGIPNDLMRDKKIFNPNILPNEMKANPLKNYRHLKQLPQKPVSLHNAEYNMEKMSPTSTSNTSTPSPQPIIAYNALNQKTCNTVPSESSISQLERTASLVQNPTKGRMSDFQQSLTSITQTHAGNVDGGKMDPYKPGPKSRKKANETSKPEAATTTPDRFKTPANNSPSAPVPSNSTPTSGSTQPGGFPQSAFPGGELASSVPGFPEGGFHQTPADPNLQQQFGTFPGYPATTGAYPPPYPPSPYYQPYPPATYPPYPQYHAPSPYPPTPYHTAPYPSGYPPYPNPNHQW